MTNTKESRAVRIERERKERARANEMRPHWDQPKRERVKFRTVEQSAAIWFGNVRIS